ncbi:hypothetical protein [Halomonas sp. I5-271120]|uniref:hypothetical protein n=1 Tax=Halomonas sp. I5-271120 TaxID=3061632 RepID=UPI002714F8CE|nr:hypothetical protein [Halomonas sp. I5-271120]
MPSATENMSHHIWSYLEGNHVNQDRPDDSVASPQSDLCRKDRTSRSALVWQISQRLPAHVNADGVVTDKGVRQITDELYEWLKETQPTPPRRRHHQRRVEAIVASLNALPELTILLPTRAVPMPRPSHAPTSIQETQGLAAMQVVDRHLDAWRKQTHHPDRWLLTLAIRMGCRLGMGPKVLVGTLALLGTRHVDKANRRVKLPSQFQNNQPLQEAWENTGTPGAPTGGKQGSRGLENDPAHQSMGYYTLQLPRAVMDPLTHLLHVASGQRCEWLALERPGKTVPKPHTRQQQLQKRLDHAAKTLLKEMKQAYPQHRSTLNRLSSWSTMGRYAALVAQHKGIASVWLDILSDYPLPTDSGEPITCGNGRDRYAPGGRGHRHETSHQPEALNHHVSDAALLRPKGRDSRLKTDDLAVTTPGGTDGDVQPLSIDQSYALRHAVLRFSGQLQSLTTVNKLKAQRYQAPLRQLRHDTMKKLTEIVGTEDSFGHWLVAFACSQLVHHESKISSVRTYLSRLMPPPLLLHDAIADVPGWDQDSVDELCNEGQSYKRWGHNTRQHFLRTMGMFIQFCQDYHILEDVNPPSSSEAHLSTRRTRMVNPLQMDQAWRSLVGHTHPSQTNTQFALSLALGYYAGLRASEVCQLTLRDIRIEQPDLHGEWAALHQHFAKGLQASATPDSKVMLECWVYIRCGKTSSARRRLPLHLLAPPEVTQCLVRWWDTRRDVAPTHDLKDIGLFGPLFSPLAYQRQGLIDPLLDWLRQRWGSGIDFHGLRHSAASWWQLRLHAAQHADFRESLHYRFHWMFQPEALEHFLVYLCGAEGSESIEKGSLIGQLAKLIGHRHVNTLLHTYSHSLGLIHSHALDMTWSNRRATS